MTRSPLYNLDYLTGPYSDVDEISEVKRYVNAALKIDETCEFPNLVYKGWCSRGGEKWQTDFCYWSPSLFAEWFGEQESARLVFLRWQVEQGMVGR